MAPELDHVHSRQDHLYITIEEDSLALNGRSVKPFGIVFGQVDRAVKLLRPDQMSAVEVRMRDRNRFQPASRLDEVDGILIEKADAIPKNIASWSLDQNRSLTDCELWAGED